jgi:hypothetical protein
MSGREEGKGDGLSERRSDWSGAARSSRIGLSWSESRVRCGAVRCGGGNDPVHIDEAARSRRFAVSRFRGSAVPPVRPLSICDSLPVFE